MDKYSFNDMEMTVGSDAATKEIKGLVYYDTLTELEKPATPVWQCCTRSATAACVPAARSRSAI